MLRERGLVWLGVRTEAFAETARLYGELLGAEPYQADEMSVRFRLADGTEAHVYGPRDDDHRFFGTAPVVGFRVDGVDAVRARLAAAGIEFLTGIERAGGTAWCHFRGPDGNVYEILGADVATLPR